METQNPVSSFPPFPHSSPVAPWLEQVRKPPIKSFNAAFPKMCVWEPYFLVSHEKVVLWLNTFEKHWINQSEFRLGGISLRI